MAKSGKIWVVVANCSYADIYSVDLGRDIQKVHHLDFPGGRKRDNEINTDRPGRSFNSMGGSRHALGNMVDPHSHELQIFAHKIATLLHQAYFDKAFAKIALICPPQFLGELRSLLSDSLTKVVYKEINKDLPASLSEGDRIAHFCKLLEMKRPAAALAG